MATETAGRLGYGVIGLGFFGEKHAEVAASLPNVSLRAVCTRRDWRRRDIARRLAVPADYRDYADLLADPQIQAVSIVTHVDDHLEPAIAALRAGKHVLIEKPLARTVTQCDRLLAEAEKSARILMVGHICRFNPRYAVARERIVRGEIGDIVSIFARRNIPAERSEEVLQKVGPLLGDGIHDTDLMLWMTGDEVESVYALTHQRRKLKYPDLGWAMYRFRSGAVGVIENVWFLPCGTPFRIHEQMEIIGTTGAIYIHGADTNVVVQSSTTIDCPDTIYWPQLHGEIVGALRNEIQYFVDCVIAGRPPAIVTPREAREAVAAVLAAERSAETGRVVKLHPKCK
jgi:UDP-N-acetylglucosamine 3-dehydrogenase